MIRPFLLCCCGSGRLLGEPGRSSGFDGFGFVISYRTGRESVMSSRWRGPTRPFPQTDLIVPLQPHVVRQCETWTRAQHRGIERNQKELAGNVLDAVELTQH